MRNLYTKVSEKVKCVCFRCEIRYSVHLVSCPDPISLWIARKDDGDERRRVEGVRGFKGKGRMGLGEVRRLYYNYKRLSLPSPENKRRGGGGFCQDHVHHEAQAKIILLNMIILLVETTKSQSNCVIVITYHHCYC